MRFTQVLILSTIVALSGCKIEQTYVFNDDFSGEMTQSIDYSGSKELMEMDSTAGQNGKVSLLPDSVIEEINAEMEDIDGVKLVSLSDEDYKLTMKLAFEHLEALNQAVKTETGDTSNVQVYCQFRNEDDAFWIDFLVDDPSENTDAAEDETDNLEMNMDGLYEMISYRFEFRFAQKIEIVSGPTAVVQNDGQSVVVEQSMQQLLAPDFVGSIEIRLK